MTDKEIDCYQRKIVMGYVIFLGLFGLLGMLIVS